MADDEDFAAMFEESIQSEGKRRKTLRAGQRVEGTVVAITDDTIFVDLGTRLEAQLPLSALEGDPVAVGEQIKATVTDPGGRGAPILKRELGRGTTDLAELEAAASTHTPVEGKFTKAVKGGIEVDIGGMRAFCPASQVDLGYVADLEGLVGQHHFFEVLEVKDRRSIVVSRKAILQRERERQADELAARIEVGAELDGIVQGIQPYGVFVELGGLQGLVHVSEISHTRVGSPSDAVEVGENVRVKVLSIDRSAKDTRISLSMKALQQPPADAGAAPGEVITAKITKIESFGLLVETAAGAGLVPNAELDLPPGSDPRRAFRVGEDVDVVVLRREGSGRLRFSKKAVEEVEARRNFHAFRESSNKERGLGSLGDLLKDKLKS